MQKLPTPPNDQALCLSPADVRKTLSRINPRKAAGLDNIPGCVLNDRADRCPNRYLQHLAEPGSNPHMSQIHDNHTGTKEITCVLSKRLPSHCTDTNHNEVLWEVSHTQRDPLQFAYCLNRSTDDAISSTLHLALTHLEIKSSQVTFIYTALLTIQIVTKHCTISK